MTNIELLNLLEQVGRGTKTPEHAYERIKKTGTELRLFYITSILITAFITLMVYGCYQSA